jgi:cytochrome P450
MTIKYGKVWVFSIPRKPLDFVLIDPAAVNHILKVNFDNYIKGDDFREALFPFLGDGIFNTNGSCWKQQRQIASHLFKVRELRNMVPIFVRHGQEVVAILKANEGQPLDVQALFCRATLDSIGEIAFGKVIGSLKKDVSFSTAFDTTTIASDYRFRYPCGPRGRRWSGSCASVRDLDAFAQEVIDERRQKSLDEGTDLLSRCLNTTDDHGLPFSDKFLRDIIMNFMIAGRDTTAQTLTWLFYLLSQYPAVGQQAVDEVENELKGEVPSYDNVLQLKYLERVINETLRLYPPVPVDRKSAVKDDVLPDGTFIPAGSDIAYSPWVLGRHPDYWADPLSCKPDRWLGSEHNGGKSVPSVGTLPFIPFNYGPRTCLGVKMAYLEVKVLACIILQQLALALEPGHDVSYQPALTISARHGMKMIPALRTEDRAPASSSGPARSACASSQPQCTI